MSCASWSGSRRPFRRPTLPGSLMPVRHQLVPGRSWTASRSRTHAGGRFLGKEVPVSLTSTSRVVVLGGTSGIGLAVALAAAVAGAQVVVGSRSAGSVERALAQLPGSAAGRAVDVTAPGSLQSFFAGAGEFDHLAYTAGDALV